MNDFFKLEENGTNVKTEILAGFTTFFAMAYIIFVNPAILGLTGIPTGAVFLATIFATVIGTLVMALFANVPYALAPGMGLNAFFTFTVCFALGFDWDEALGLVFICGLINVLITVTKVRKHIIRAIPVSLQCAIGGGIGIFIAYIGFKNAGMLKFTADPGHWFFLVPDAVTNVADAPNVTGVGVDSSIVPALQDFSSWGPILAVIGLVLTIVLLLLKVKGAILIGIILTTVINAVRLVLLDKFPEFTFDVFGPFEQLGDTMFAALTSMGSLFGDVDRLPMALLAIFAFSLTDTFDTIGTFVGTGRKTGIFTEADLEAVEEGTGFKTKMEKALFADSIATSVGALFGTSNTTTYIESAAGIEAGGRTGLTSVVTAILFLLCIFVSPLLNVVPAEATAPALIVVGIMMVSSFKDINWEDLGEAVPAFFAAVLMALAYNISIGIGFGFITYVIVKLSKKELKDIHPILWICTFLFLAYFVLMGLFDAGII